MTKNKKGRKNREDKLQKITVNNEIYTWNNKRKKCSKEKKHNRKRERKKNIVRIGGRCSDRGKESEKNY